MVEEGENTFITLRWVAWRRGANRFSPMVWTYNERLDLDNFKWHLVSIATETYLLLFLSHTDNISLSLPTRQRPAAYDRRTSRIHRHKGDCRDIRTAWLSSVHHHWGDKRPQRLTSRRYDPLLLPPLLAGYCERWKDDGVGRVGGNFFRYVSLVLFKTKKSESNSVDAYLSTHMPTSSLTHIVFLFSLSRLFSPFSLFSLSLSLFLSISLSLSLSHSPCLSFPLPPSLPFLVPLSLTPLPFTAEETGLGKLLKREADTMLTISPLSTGSTRAIQGEVTLIDFPYLEVKALRVK